MMDGGLCAQIGGDLWFPDTSGAQTAEVRLAKQICLKCPIRQRCLDYALTNNERYGVWGGLTERERGSLLRRLPKVAQRQSEPQEQPFGEHGTTAGCKRHYLRGEKPCLACRDAYNRARNERRRKPA
jgi:WhiB family transcriptional regulator, redox-sensing transcriptional regulator